MTGKSSRHAPEVLVSGTSRNLSQNENKDNQGFATDSHTKDDG